MAGSDRPEWPPRSSRPDDPGDPGGEAFDFDYGVLDDVAPPPRRPAPRPEPGPRPERPQRRDSGDKQPAARTKSTHSRGNLLWRWRRGFFVLGLIGMAAVAAGVSTVAQTELPPLTRLAGSTFICATGVPEGQCDASTALVKLSEDEDRVFVPLDQIPEHVREAVIAAEDRDFYDHKGIDPMGIGRALVRDVRGGGLSQGGSTITQQLVKNAFLLDADGAAERSVGRKVKEAVLAMKIEKQMSKDEILERYLNEIYFGRKAYGIQAASWAYFGKRIQDVGIQEAAYLAGLIRRPEGADPYDHPEEAARRRGTVLDAMAEERYITADERDLVDAVDIATYVSPSVRYRQSVYNWPNVGGAQFGVEYITDYVEEETVEKLTEALDLTEEEAKQEVAQGGLRVYTTIDPMMQEHAYNAVNSVLDDPAADPSAALVAVDDQGMVRAMVGGRDYASQSVNLASGNSWGRQVGSTFKPIALSSALNEGYSLQRSTVNAPGEIPTEQTDDCDARTFKNYSSEGAREGRLNLIDATKASSNTGYVDLMVKLGPQTVLDMASQLGMNVESENRGHIPCPTTVLGSGGSSPLEMAEVYSTFANRGVHKEPTIITRIERADEDGDLDVVWTWQPDEDPVMTQSNADLVTHALRQVIDGGTGEGANIGKPAAGKTGTTSNNRDAWFVGYVPKLTAAVWMGYANPDPAMPVLDENGQQKLDRNGQPINHVPTMNSDDVTGRPVRGLNRGVTGGSFPADIWAAFMEQATANMSDEDLQFVEPTPDQLRGGTPLDPNNTGEAPATTLPPEEEEDPEFTIPDITVSTPRPPSSSTPPSSTPSTSAPTTVWPPVTGPDRPGNGDGTETGN